MPVDVGTVPKVRAVAWFVIPVVSPSRIEVHLLHRNSAPRKIGKERVQLATQKNNKGGHCWPPLDFLSNGYG